MIYDRKNPHENPTEFPKETDYSFLTLHTHMSSIGHLVLYLVDPVSDDTTSGLEHTTKTQRDLIPPIVYTD